MDAKYFEGFVNCNAEPTVNDCVKISKYFNITIDYLLGIRSVGETIDGTQDEETSDFFCAIILKATVLQPTRFYGILIRVMRIGCDLLKWRRMDCRFAKKRQT